MECLVCCYSISGNLLNNLSWYKGNYATVGKDKLRHRPKKNDPKQRLWWNWFWGISRMQSKDYSKSHDSPEFYFRKTQNTRNIAWAIPKRFALKLRDGNNQLKSRNWYRHFNAIGAWRSAIILLLSNAFRFIRIESTITYFITITSEMANFQSAKRFKVPTAEWSSNRQYLLVCTLKRTFCSNALCYAHDCNSPKRISVHRIFHCSIPNWNQFSELGRRTVAQNEPKKIRGFESQNCILVLISELRCHDF